ncbi:MAG: hypothetical protein M1814_006597 [Vezdaea aestivalis]|nr:MAG: hypothetical protein M1814_006597 [Vezdaea aestivalis]
MDIDSGVSGQAAMVPAVHKTTATILCYNCGAPIDGTISAGALCNDCIKLTIDISAGIQREAVISFCRDCDRWLQPPNQWIVAAPESQQLLALCLRKLTGLNKTRLIDAGFIWTEPHSRRVKVRLTIQGDAGESAGGAILQQTFVVEYRLGYHQCPDCAKSYTANTWRAVVQLRQKIAHKRTFLYLEQLMLKHQAHRDAINIKEARDGLDFFFSQRNHAEKFLEFLASVSPVKSKKSSELISMNIQESTKSYKFTYSAELVPICRENLVALPIKLAAQLGNIYPITICTKIGTAITLLDPRTLQTADLAATIYWRSPFRGIIADTQDLVEFVVMELDLLGPKKGRYVLAEATVARASDLGSNDQTYYTRTHLGGVLHVGDSVMGYDLSNTNFNNPNLEAVEQSGTFASAIPDVVLIKKAFVRNEKHAKKRTWKLKRFGKEESDMAPRKQDADREERDYEMFLRDVEEDEELRATLALYKSSNKGTKMQVDNVKKGQNVDEMDTESEQGEVPVIGMDELLEDLEDLDVNDP